MLKGNLSSDVTLNGTLEGVGWITRPVTNVAGVPYDTVVARYHEPDEERFLTEVPRDRLPQEYQDALATAQVGDIVGPIESDRGNGRLTYTVLELRDVRAEGLVSFDDVRDQLRSSMARQNGIERFLRNLRDATYIEIRL